MIEEKHRVSQALSIKTRGTATLLKGPPGSGIPDEVLAKCGISPPEGCLDPNAYLVALYFDRRPGQKTMTRPFISVRYQWLYLSDVFRLEREVRMNLEYDFKRRPVRPRMVQAGEYEHLAFDTEPWPTAADAQRARLIFDEWRRSRCLKTLKDFEDWEDHYRTHIALDKLRSEGRKVPVQVTKGGSVGILVRMFLRAYAQQLWGIQRTESYSRVADILSSFGHETSVNDVKNGSRGEAYPNIVPRTSRTESLMKDLMLAFSGVNPVVFFID